MFAFCHREAYKMFAFRHREMKKSYVARNCYRIDLKKISLSFDPKRVESRSMTFLLKFFLLKKAIL